VNGLDSMSVICAHPAWDGMIQHTVGMGKGHGKALDQNYTQVFNSPSQPVETDHLGTQVAGC
jgi:hypothetical protein